MKQFTRYTTRLAGLSLLIGPGLVVSAALLAAAGIGTTTTRWYDNQLEGLLMASGFSLQLVGLVELCRRIGAERPLLGTIITFTSAIGTMGSIFPAAVRIFSAVELDLGITVAQLDRIYGPASDGIDPMIIVFPFVLFFFINYLLLSFGLWRSKIAPRVSPILLVIGTILFIIGQSSFEVGYPAYIGGVIAWFLGLTPISWRLLSENKPSEEMLSQAISGN